MLKSMRYSFLTWGLLILPSMLSAQGLFGNNGRSVRAIGLGGAHLIAAPDPFAAAWNPASLAALREAQFSVSSENDFNLSAVGVAGFWPRTGGIGITLMRLVLSNNDIDRINFGWGRALSSYLTGGLSLHGSKVNDENYFSTTLGLIAHPLGNRLPVSMNLRESSLFNSPLLPYKFAFGFQVNDLHIGKKFFDTYYKISAAIRMEPVALSLLTSFEWQEGENLSRIGLAYAFPHRFAMYGGIAKFDTDQAALGTSYIGESYAFDVAYLFGEKLVTGGLSIRLGASASLRARQHFDDGTQFAKSKDYRASLQELHKFRVYDSHSQKAKILVDALSIKIAEDDKKIEKFLSDGKKLETKKMYISAALNYLKVLKYDHQNKQARGRIKAIQPRIDIYTNQLFTRGEQAFEAGNYVVALRAFETIHMVRNDHKVTAVYLAKIAEIRHKEADKIFWRGLGYYSQKKFTRALQDFQETQRLNPKHLEAPGYIKKTFSEIERQNVQINRLIAEGQRLEKRQQYMSAYKRYRKILNMDSEHESARVRMQALQKRIDRFVGKKNKSGKLAFKRGDYERASRSFDAVLKLSPGNRTAKSYHARIIEIKRSRTKENFRYAMSLFEGRLWKQAVEALERVLDFDPSHKVAMQKRNEALSLIGLKELFEQGKLYYSKGKYYHAMETFDQVLLKDPTSEEARKYLEKSSAQLELEVERIFNRGLGYYASEEYEDAINEWTGALELNPHHAESSEYIDQAQQKLEALENLAAQ